MLVHIVVFKLKAGMSADERAAFETDLRSLAAIEEAKHFEVGTVAATAKRPVVDTDWDFMLTVIVEDVAAHDRYQAHPVHQAFIEKQKAFFEQVRVFDAD